MPISLTLLEMGMSLNRSAWNWISRLYLQRHCPIPLFSIEKTVWKISFISLGIDHSCRNLSLVKNNLWCHCSFFGTNCNATYALLLTLYFDRVSVPYGSDDVTEIGVVWIKILKEPKRWMKCQKYGSHLFLFCLMEKILWWGGPKTSKSNKRFFKARHPAGCQFFTVRVPVGCWSNWARDSRTKKKKRLGVWFYV